jgi:uncharacterized protein
MRFLLLLHLLLSGHMLARPHVLVVTATAGYRHESIATAEYVLQSIANEQDLEISFVRTEDEMRAILTRSGLGEFKAVFFANTSGELPTESADAIVTWVREGGTFVGIHSASDTWHNVPDYVEMVGGEFVGHPPETSAVVVVDDATHPATRGLPSSHVLYEEFYYIGKFDSSRVRPLLSIRVRPETPGDSGYWPLAWDKPFGRGRVLYSAVGHREDVWLSEWFQTHLAGIAKWAVAVVPQQVKRRAVRH